MLYLIAIISLIAGAFMHNEFYKMAHAIKLQELQEAINKQNIYAANFYDESKKAYQRGLDAKCTQVCLDKKIQKLEGKEKLDFVGDAKI